MQAGFNADIANLPISMIQRGHSNWSTYTKNFVMFFFGLFESYSHPCSAYVGYIGTDRSLLTGHDAVLLQQIARDLLHALSHRHDNTWMAFG